MRRLPGWSSSATKFVDHLTKFWINYNALKGQSFDLRGVYGPDRAADALQQASEPDHPPARG